MNRWAVQIKEFSGESKALAGAKYTKKSHKLVTAMAEKTFTQPRCYWGNLAITQFNRQTGNEIYLLDLDHAGANLETPFPLSPDYPVEFSFVLPGSPEEIKASGRVLWKQQLSIPLGRYHIRVQFYVPRWDLDRLLQDSRLLS